MWRHIKGVTKPGEQTTHKRKPDDETKKEEETKKNKRLFNEKWKSGREWLVYDPVNKIIYCSDCRAYGGEKVKVASFVVGTSNFKVETVKDHEVSIGHIGSISTKRAKAAGLLQDSVVVKSLVLMKSAEFEKMGMLFRNVHAIGKKGRPFTDYVWMCE